MPVLSWDHVARALTISAYDSSFCSKLHNAATLTTQLIDAINDVTRKLKSVAKRGMANLRCERHEF